MTTSQKYQNTKLSAACPDMDWQTPAVSEKFQRRFGWRPAASDSGDTGIGTTHSDSAEDFCSSGSSPAFQPIRSQIPIPTAHVMPSTAGAPASKPLLRSSDEAPASSSSTSRNSSSTSSSKSSLPKSASSPNLDAQGGGGADATGPRPDCLSRYRSLVNGLDHSLFPSGDHTRSDEAQRFDVPTVEPTLNQSALLGGLGALGTPEIRQQLQMSGLADGGGGEGYQSSLEQSYKALPEARLGQSGNVADLYGHRGAPPGAAYGYPQPGSREQMGSAAYDALPTERGGDMANWQQQKQKLENLRLQVEQMQLMAGGATPYASLYPAALHSEASKWDAVVKANENLLKEKELVIERQKQQMLQLEQRLRESELQVHGALMGRGAPFADVCLLRLQEAQRENAFLRAQFAERSDSFTQEKMEAERRLGTVEAETRRLSDTLRESSERHAEEMKKQEERIRSRDKHIGSLKKKCQKESEQNREKQQRIETLERYLADLPTMEDYQTQSKQLEELEQRVAELQGREADLGGRLEEARAATRDRDSQLEEQRRRERELLSNVTSLQERVQEGLADGARLPTLDMEKLQDDNNNLKGEVQRLKKVVEKQHRMMEQLGSKIRNLEEQVSQEESTSQALREELAEREQELLQRHTAMKELSGQNQELLEQNLTLQERLEEQQGQGGPGLAELGPPSQAAARLTQRLHGEMAACLFDLRSLCNILTQRAQGRDPNLSLLLGITSPPPVGEQWEDWLSPDVLQKKLVEARQLRHDVEELRSTISDRYAQDMGENCITQ